MKKINGLSGDPRLKELFRKMKVTLLLVLLSAGVVFAGKSYSQTKMLNLRMGKTTVKEVLSKIEEQSEFYFMFSSKIIDVNREVQVDAENRKIDEVLNEIFKGTNVEYTIKDRIIVLTTPEVLSEGSLTEFQQKSVSGKVTDTKGQSLPGVTVVVKGTTTGTITNADGTFVISNVQPEATLVFSFVGMKSQEVVVGGKTNINVTLMEETVGIEEVVAVGYGTMKKRDLTGSISQVKSEALMNKPNASPAALLAGRAAGVQVQSNTGAPGSGLTIRIRGNTSFNAGNDPLYIVDGVPSGDISSINPNEIESLEILKDASASAIYGARASNGVVIITTKRGKTGKPVYEFSSYYGLQQVTKTIPYLNGEEQYQAVLDGIANFNRNNPTNPTVIRAQAVADHNAGYNTNWQNEVFRTAPVFNADLNIQRGNDDFRMSFGLNYYNQTGIIIGSDYQRYRGKFNFDMNASKKVRIGGTFTFSKQVNDKIPDGISTDAYSVMGNVMRKLAYEPVYEPDGSYSVRERANPVAQALETHIFDYFTKGLGSTYLEYDIVDHLTFKTMTAIDYRDLKSEFFRPKTIDGGAARPASFSGGDYFTWLSENTLTYSNVYNKIHRVTALIGYSAQKSNDYTYSGAAQNGTSDAIYTLNTSALKTNATSYKTAWGINSIFGRINYSLKDKYLLTANLRQDGSSRFGGEKRFAIFPAMSAGWRISEESFFDAVPYISDLKLRGSAGRTGNQTIGNYASMGLYSAGANYVGSPGMYQGNLPNDQLSWETTDQFDLGVDLGVFDNRLTLVVDAYQKRTNGLLFSVPVPSTTGFTNALQNLGRIENKGLEFSLNANIIEKKTFTWTSDFNISFNRNKVLELPNHNRIIYSYNQVSYTDATYTLTQEGSPMGLFYGLKWTGKVYATNEEAKADIPLVKGRPNWGGNYQYEDISGPKGVPDKSIDYDYDRQVIGDPNPDFIGGWNNTFKYKNFELTCSMQFVYGNDIYNENRRMASRFVYNAYGKEFVNAWKTPGQITTVHKTYAGTDDENFQSLWIEDGSFLKVKDLTLGYNLPASILAKMKMAGFRFYVSGYNLLTLTKYKGFDPDVNAQSQSPLSTGIDAGVYPQMRSFLVGLNLKF